MDKACAPVPAPGQLAIDSGLRCPECRYNLTGLTEPRCPECGMGFEWEAVRAAAGAPAIAFERARGWGRVPGFFVTAATVLFAPWIFARQATRRMSLGSGLLFALVCFASTALALLLEVDVAEVWGTWMVTAVLFLPVQAVWLALLDREFYRKPWRTLRFWLLVGCYTSAVMLTEAITGPPMVFVNDLWKVVLAPFAATLQASFDAPWFGDLYQPTWTALVSWSQMAVWLVALGCCVAARRTRGASLFWVLLRVGMTLWLLLLLYATALRVIGVAVWGYLER